MNRYVARFTAFAALAAATIGFASPGWAADVTERDARRRQETRPADLRRRYRHSPASRFQDSAGKWQGLDIAYCQAIAAAVLGDPEKVKYVGTTAKVRFSVLQSGEIDVLIRDSTSHAHPQYRSRPCHRARSTSSPARPSW
jgi:general L-amino acid transport system substrate-binding protein